jgi:hypothetical protein
VLDIGQFSAAHFFAHSFATKVICPFPPTPPVPPPFSAGSLFLCLGFVPSRLRLLPHFFALVFSAFAHLSSAVVVVHPSGRSQPVPSRVPTIPTDDQFHCQTTTGTTSTTRGGGGGEQIPWFPQITQILGPPFLPPFPSTHSRSRPPSNFKSQQKKTKFIY